MASVLCEATKFVVDQGFAGSALAGSGALIVSLTNLVRELHGSKEMCQDLIANIGSLLPQLKTMLKNDNIKTSKDMLTAYESLLREVEVFLQNHVDSSPLARVISHLKMKKRVQQFYVDLEKIKALLELKFQEEAANRHGDITGRLDRCLKIEEQTQTALSDDLRALTTQMETKAQELVAALGKDKYVTVADLKHELKTHQDMYTNSQVKQFKSILKMATALAPLPHLSRWYLSRSDFRFDERSPFITGQFRSIHYGTLVSGAEVTIKTVVAERGDEKTRDQFRKEVETWYALRDPHVLPLYGANDIGSPMVFACGRAEFGNFNEYLSTHPHQFWQVFLDAARGLAYLHKQKHVHGNLKCNNLLVTKHGVGVLSDFFFAFVRTNSALSLKAQAPDHFWKAPECFNSESPNPRFESDVYSLGMCIFEAMSGAPPFAEIEEQDAIVRIREGELPQRPDGRITDEAWNLITSMCRRTFQDRVRLESVIAELEVLAAQEQIKRSQLPCSCVTTCCLECGGQRRFSSSKGALTSSTTEAAPAAS
ncbi:Serine/threonine protein kinase, partial [Globisporangium splendens]